MSVSVASRLVRVHIDRQAYEVPSLTTGEHLYKIAEVPKHRELYREVSGDHEDELIPRDDTPIRVAEDEHFYSQKTVTILVNGEATELTETRLSYEALVNIAFPVPPTGECIEFTATYRNGPPANPKGTLTSGHSVKIKNRMIFDVTPTDRS